MILYPNFSGPHHALQNFNLDVFYHACKDDNAKCKHIYIYRDPYAVLKSTTINRHYNHNIYESIRLYTEVLQQVHSQFVSHPERNLGCFRFFDSNGSQLQQDWDRFGSLWGWDHDAFATMDKRDFKSPKLLSNKMKDEMVPPGLLPMMRVYKDIFNRVNVFCYSSLQSMEVTPYNTTEVTPYNTTA